MEHQALDAAVNGLLEFDFKRLFTDQLFEGLMSKGYVEVLRSGLVSIRLPGIRRLMDIEGLPYD